jgi:replicative DNA helicase
MRYKDLESAILHSYASDNDLFAPCEHLAFEDIWQENHNKVIFKIIKDNHSKKVKTDLHLLKNGLIKAGYEKLEIRTILEGFHNSDSSIKANILAHMNIVFEVYSRRKMKPVLHRAYNELFSNNGDIDENINAVKDVFNELDSIKNNLSVDKSIKDIYREALKEFKDAQNNKKEIIGYRTGLNELDTITCGLKQEVIVVGAPPGSGKTSLMINLAKNVAILQNNPLIIFSLEMPATQLMKNIFANCLTINSWQIRSGNASKEDEEKVEQFEDQVKENLIIDDTYGITWQYVETRLRKMRRTIPMSTVIVCMIDYIQLMRLTWEEMKGQSEERQMAILCNMLQELSKKYNICMIELCQVTREVSKVKEGRNGDADKVGRPPRMSDLKGSGAIEANAVQVWLLYRPDYYTKEPKDELGMDLRGLCEINVAKNRYGETRAIYVRFMGKYSAFEDYKPDDKGSDEQEAF